MPLLLLLAIACHPTKNESALLETGEPGIISEDRLLSHVQTLSSVEYAGRGTGQPGGELAAVYEESHFESLGLQPLGDQGTWRQPFDVQLFSLLAPSELVIGKTRAREGSDYIVFHGSGSSDLTAEVAFVGFGLTIPPFNQQDYPDCPFPTSGFDEYAGMDVKGSVVLVLRHGPNDDEAQSWGCPTNDVVKSDESPWSFGYKAANAAQHGARAMMLVNDYNHAEPEASGGNLGTWYNSDFSSLFLDRRIAEASFPDMQAWQQQIERKARPASVATGVDARIYIQTSWENATVPNILGSIPGTDLADEIVVVGAHFDHLGTDPSGTMYPGADDNASGSAVMMELATQMARSSETPRRTIVFAGFNGEELGLLGSLAYVSSPPLPLDDTVAMLDLDMVGGGNNTGLNVFGGTLSDLGWLYDLIASYGEPAFQVLAQDFIAGSDHAPFYLAGVPAVCLLTIGPHAVYHTPKDTFDTISGPELVNATWVAREALRTLAMGEEDPASNARVRQTPQEAPRERHPLGMPRADM